MISERISELMETLQREGIAFCHWKSNAHLATALAAGGELDLLVARHEAQRFEAVLATLNFKRAVDPVQGAFPAVIHFYGSDPEQGQLLHLHVYYRITTGDSLLKNYSFPVEPLFLNNPRQMAGLPVPNPSAELMLFVIRVMLKHTSLVEYWLLRRRSGLAAMRAELQTLSSDGTVAHCLKLIKTWLPGVNPTLFGRCLEALQTNLPFHRRLGLALQLQAQLHGYSRLSFLQSLNLRAVSLYKRLFHRLRGGGKSKQLTTGGAVIAFVGPEATGKSTLVHETARWLGQAFEVTTVHLGKPPSTWLTVLPNLAMPLLRKMIPQRRTSQIEKETDDETAGRSSLLYSLRAVWTAWERRALALRIRRQAVNGSLIICDRYPSLVTGAMDSPRLKLPPPTQVPSGWRSSLAEWEHRLYRQIPPPDVVIQLTVPVEVAIERNQERQKQGKEDAAYVWRRHTTSVLPTFAASRVIELDTHQSKVGTLQAARIIVWDAL